MSRKNQTGLGISFDAMRMISEIADETSLPKKTVLDLVFAWLSSQTPEIRQQVLRGAKSSLHQAPDDYISGVDPSLRQQFSSVIDEMGGDERHVLNAILFNYIYADMDTKLKINREWSKFKKASAHAVILPPGLNQEDVANMVMEGLGRSEGFIATDPSSMARKFSADELSELVRIIGEENAKAAKSGSNLRFMEHPSTAAIDIDRKRRLANGEKPTGMRWGQPIFEQSLNAKTVPVGGAVAENIDTKPLISMRFAAHTPDSSGGFADEQSIANVPLPAGRKAASPKGRRSGSKGAPPETSTDSDQPKK
jgi:hypothetical protein